MVAVVKAFADKHLERFVSKKLLVWLTTTGLLLAEKVDSEQWIIIAQHTSAHRASLMLLPVSKVNNELDNSQTPTTKNLVLHQKLLVGWSTYLIRVCAPQVFSI